MLEMRKKCLCTNNILYQRYNILFFDDLSITRYNKFHQIRDLSFRGYSVQSNILPKRIIFQLNVNAVFWWNYLRCLSPWRCHSVPVFLAVGIPFPLGWVRKWCLFGNCDIIRPVVPLPQMPRWIAWSLMLHEWPRLNRWAPHLWVSNP